MEYLRNLFPTYQGTKEATLKGWADHQFAVMLAARGAQGHPLPLVYVAYQYLSALFDNRDKSSAHSCNLWQFVVQGAVYPGGSFMPETPTDWRAKLAEACASLKSWQTVRPPENLFLPGCQPYAKPYDEIIAFQQGVFELARWTDFGWAGEMIDWIGRQQGDLLDELLARSELAASDLVPLLHVLSGVGLSGASGARRAVELLETLADSSEIPGGMLSEQIIYGQLMVLADPRGPYRYSHVQLVDFVAQLDAATKGDSVLAKSLSPRLQAALQMLAADAAYPMLDPYNPGIGFPKRMSDTLAAINDAWSSIRR